jgi:hypothetical protein
MIIRHWVPVGMRNVSDWSCRENQNTHFIFNNFFLRKLCRLWDNVEKQYCCARQTASEKMWYACRITKATIQTRIQNMQYLLLFHGNWLRERASVLRYTYIARLVSWKWSSNRNTTAYHRNQCLAACSVWESELWLGYRLDGPGF